MDKQENTSPNTKKEMKTKPIIALLICSALMSNCAGIHAVGPNGSKFTAMNLGGKQMMAGVRSPAVEIDTYYTDTEAAFKHAVTAAAIAWSVGQLASWGKVAQSEKTAREATAGATKVKLGEQAAGVEATKLKAGLIKDLGVKGEVPIGALNIP